MTATGTTLRTLAAQGELVSAAEHLPPATVDALRRDAYQIAWPLVYQHHTRPLERRKGHVHCAVSVQRLDPGCHDGFTDDVHAVVDYLFSYAKRSIGNLEGWITSRLGAATVDGHRRRRGAAGAQQRPRVPAWLAARLGHDTWLVTLAERILEWVGVAATAGPQIWPLDSWAELRGEVTGTWDGNPEPALVAREVDAVLSAMRETRPDWYLRFVEAPLGRKPAPVVSGPLVHAAAALQPITREEQDDARLHELATLALAMIESRLTAGGDCALVVRQVVGELFLGPGGASRELDLVPLAGPSGGEERVSAALGDPVQVARVVGTVLEVLAAERAAPGV